MAQEASIAKGTVYLYFENKEAIIAAITIKARIILLEYFKTFCEAKSEPLEKIEAIFHAYYQFYKEHYTYHELVSFYEQNTGLTENGELADMSKHISIYLNSILENAQAIGAIRKDIDCMKTTFIFWGMIVGTIQLINSKSNQILEYTGEKDHDFFQSFISMSIKSLL